MNILDLQIGTRLRIAFGSVLLLLCATAGVGVYQSSKLNDRAIELGSDWLAGVRALGELRAQANAERRTALRYLLEADAEGRARQLQAREQALAKLRQAMDGVDKLVSAPAEARLLQDVKAAWQAYAADDEKLLQMSDRGDADYAAARKFATGPSAASFATFAQAIEADVAWQTQGSEEAQRTAAATFRGVIVVNSIAVALALAAGLGLAVAITRSITVPIGRAAALARAVAGGDLTAHIEIQGRDEAAQLLAALSTMTGRLASIVGQVRSSSESIATGSTQIATGNTDLSQRTEEQASALQQTSATMDELGTTVRHNADNALQASHLASGASRVATKGGEVVSRVVDTMRGIDDSSKRIADIIGVIDGIAFQTNILALNAAVEAARAGEQGRGFAVVAGEVRVLAQRSAEAAKEIKTLITHSVEQVGQGTILVDEAGRTMSEIVDAIRRVNDIVSDISTATTEQSSGVTQVGQAVSQMDQVTQQNAALVEESAAAAESLRQQAQQLVAAVSVFKLDSNAAERPATNVAAAAFTRVAPAPRNPGRAHLARSAGTRRPLAPAADGLPAHSLERKDALEWESF
jgi:methyl-accepting chemotaxis protein